MLDHTFIAVTGIGMLICLVALKLENRGLRERIQSLETHAHRHPPPFAGARQQVRPEQCDHGFDNWDECPTCCH